MVDPTLPSHLTDSKLPSLVRFLPSRHRKIHFPEKSPTLTQRHAPAIAHFAVWTRAAAHPDRVGVAVAILAEQPAGSPQRGRRGLRGGGDLRGRGVEGLHPALPAPDPGERPGPRHPAERPLQQGHGLQERGARPPPLSRAPPAPDHELEGAAAALRGGHAGRAQHDSEAPHARGPARPQRNSVSPRHHRPH